MDSSPLPRNAPSSSPWLRAAHPYALLAIVFLAGMFPRFVFNRHSEWQDVYVSGGRLLLDKNRLYQAGHPYVYPPFMAAVSAPFALLSETASRTLWFLINALALVVAVQSAWRLAQGGTASLPGWRSSRKEHAIFWIGLGCAGYYVADSFAHQQTDLIIAALLLRGCLAIMQERAWLGGGLMGLAAAFKATPLLFLPWLMWRGRWTAALAFCLAAGGASFLPDLVHADTNGPWLAQWWRVYILPQIQGKVPPGVWASEVIYNQSLSGTLYRLLQTEWRWESAAVVVHQSSAALTPHDLQSLVRMAQLGLVGMAVWLFWNRPLQYMDCRVDPSAGERLVWESGLLFTLMLLLSPMSSKPHFCILLLLGFASAGAIVEGRSPFAIGLVSGAICCGLLANKDLVKARLYTVVLWHGAVTLSCLLLAVLASVRLASCRSTVHSDIDRDAASVEADTRPRLAA